MFRKQLLREIYRLMLARTLPRSAIWLGLNLYHLNLDPVCLNLPESILLRHFRAVPAPLKQYAVFYAVDSNKNRLIAGQPPQQKSHKPANENSKDAVQRDGR